MIKLILIYALYTYIMSFINKKQSVAFCGLIGFSGKGNYNIDKIKLIMLWNSVERGKDATGIFTPTTGVIKDNDPAGRFFYGKEIEKLQPDHTMIAHVRAKTIGVNSAKNAHPFEYEETVLAHNGTLTDVYNLGLKYDMKANDWDVDSQVLANAINKAFEKNNANPFFDVIGEYKGAAALLFYNKSTDCLYAYHDKERPLFHGWDIDGNMYISSIEDSLKAAQCFAITSFDINKVYCIKDGDIISATEYDLYAVKYKAEIEEAERIEREKKKFTRTTKAQRREAKKQQYPKLEEKQRGFRRADNTVEPFVYVDFYLKAVCDQLTVYELGSRGLAARIRKDEWYLCTGYYSDTKSIIEVEDGNGISRPSYLINFDITNFIPRKDDYIMFITDVNTKKDKKDLWKEGECTQVIEVDLEKMTVLVYSEKNKSNHNVPTIFFRLASEAEALEEGAPTEESLVETPFVEVLPEEEDESTQALLRQMRAYKDSEEMIEISVLDGFIDNVNDLMEKLSEKYEAGLDISADINEINAVLNCSSDKQFMSSYQKN